MTPTIIPTKAPNLPVAGMTYNESFENQILNALRLYFTQIDNFTRASSNVQYGTTANRPAIGENIGQMYFDTTLGIPIWYNGAKWVNSSGTIV